MYCLTRTNGRARGGSSKTLDAMTASEPGGSSLTLNYFWLTMISLAWASHAATVGPVAAPSFGVMMLGDSASHGIGLPSVTRDLEFADFMLLPPCAALGEVPSHAPRALVATFPLVTPVPKP